MEELISKFIKAKMKASYNTCKEVWFESYGTYEGFEEMYEDSKKNFKIIPINKGGNHE